MLYFFLIVAVFTFFSHGMDTATDTDNSIQAPQEQMAEKKEAYVLNIDITTTVINRTKKVGNKMRVVPCIQRHTVITKKPLK